jgi:hypothetical protein
LPEGSVPIPAALGNTRLLEGKISAAGIRVLKNIHFGGRHSFAPIIVWNSCDHAKIKASIV